MPLILSPVEARVMGCLLEKAATTPDQYPLTLNALVNACNQKSSRDPVMQLEPGEVEHTIRRLEDKHIVRVEENFKSQVSKYTHRFCNTPFSDFQFDTAQYAIICVLLLRGPRTPGELRSHCTRMHAFEDNAAVVTALQSLAGGEMNIVQELPRKAGRRDSEYVHLFYPEETLATLTSTPVSRPTPATTAPPTAPSPAPAHSPTSVAGVASSEGNRLSDTGPADTGRTDTDLAQRVAALEAQVAEMQTHLQRLSQAVDAED